MINWSYFGYLRIVFQASSSRRVPISKIKTNAQENCKLANANSNSNPNRNSNSARKRRGNLVTEGGNGNWSCDPRAQPYHSDGGVHREREGETRQRSERKEKKERSRSLIGELDRSASLVSLLQRAQTCTRAAPVETAASVRENTILPWKRGISHTGLASRCKIAQERM